MTEFDKLNLMVVPIQDPVKFHKLPNYKGYPIKWSDPSTYCSWEEREDIYPGVKEWYVIPATKHTYQECGMDVAYYVIDVDNHEGDAFDLACEFLRSCHLPKSLTIRTPSGGIHRYYKTFADAIPRGVNGIEYKGHKLPIEIKSTVGVVAPNGRDRKIIDDSPVAMFIPDDSSLFSQVAMIKEKKPHAPRKPVDPDFDIKAEEFPDSAPGDRHNTLMAKATSLYARGCPPDKIIWWGEEFYHRTGRKEQRNEISNIVRDAMNYIDSEEDDLDELMADYNTPQPTTNAPQTSPEPREAPSTIEVVSTTISEPTPTLESLLGAYTELTGAEKLFATSLFSTKAEIKQDILEYSKQINQSDMSKLKGLITKDENKMRQVWVSLPREMQVEYYDFKNTVKLLLEK